jgi:hypothetical protein
VEAVSTDGQAKPVRLAEARRMGRSYTISVQKGVTAMTNQTNQKTFACETCAARMKAEQNPNAFMSKLWRWHTGWCPGWKAYQKHLAEQAKIQNPN